MMKETKRDRKGGKIQIPRPIWQKAGSKMSAYNKSRHHTLIIAEFFNSLS